VGYVATSREKPFGLKNDKSIKYMGIIVKRTSSKITSRTVYFSNSTFLF